MVAERGSQVMSEINRSRASLRTRGRYIVGKLDTAKRILTNADSIPAQDYQETCEHIMVLIETIQTKEQAYSEVFEDLHEKVIPLCIGNQTEEDRHNTEYDQWIALKEECENVLGDLKGFLNILKFRMDLSKSQTSHTSQTSLKQPVVTVPISPADRLLSKIDEEISQIDKQLEEMSLTVPRGGIDEYLHEIPPSHGLVPEFNLSNIHSSDGLDDYRKWLAPDNIATQPVAMPTVCTPSIPSARSVHWSNPVESTPAIPQPVNWNPLLSSTPIGSSGFRAECQRVSDSFSTHPYVTKSTPYTTTTTSVVYTSGFMMPKVSSEIGSWLMPDAKPPDKGIYTMGIAGVSCSPTSTPIFTHATSAPTQIVNSTQSNPQTDVSVNLTPSALLDPLSFDLSRVIQRVRVPKFKGDKVNYENWKGAFMSLVDKTNYSAEYKLMLLRDSLEGEPLKCIESLGYSAAAYNTAKQRLERKYGGIRRQLTLRLEDVDRFKPIKDNNEKDLQGFAELLDVLVVQLVETGNLAELYSVSMNLRVQAKLSKSLLAKYRQWLREYAKEENLYTLRDFVNQQSEDLIQAGEVIRGITQKSKTPENAQSFVSHSAPSTGCAVCNESHPVWFCDKFKALSTEERWNKIKELGLCFRCLSAGHLGRDCKNVSLCNIDNCKANHNRLLHGGKKPDNSDGDKIENTSRGAEQIAHVTTMTTGKGDEVFSLRTVPVKVRNGPATMTIHALLDDCSDTSYVNEEITNELDINGEREDVTVNTLNGHKTELNDTAEVNFTIESVDGKVSMPMSAYITNNVAGDLKVTDWNKAKKKYDHLKDIKFPKFDKNHRKISMLIGADMSDLLYSLQDVRGEPGQPIARLTPLGWTCIGHLRS